ncbi:probable thiosulfate sulfurtransferase/rhodanese-like domain-containing protein at N-terminal half [Coccomyxa sp. Obi]|nr:probable thiosulfate sulfurtransferase/rhodanese-like domain-containing protein at N-terminal half [Coccomyxa sp. Obi]
MEASTQGILLYYKYVDLTDQQTAVQQWMQSLCEDLGLRGRIRVARDGINTTVGGSMAALRAHIDAVHQHHLLGTGIDFKLASSSGPSSTQAARETGFQSLTVSMCQEVVALGDGPVSDPQELEKTTAPHVSPQLFHDLLDQSKEGSSKETVLLDVRNLYETRIGHFHKEGVRLLDPQLRSFNELRTWLDRQAAALANRRVLMYCTGGVRCERASAYLRSKGPAFQDVVQLSGGIQRYMEAFPDGGFFAGKNFVFDERVTVAGGSERVVGRCCLCSCAHDTYEPRCRCSHCRMLVLVCPGCTSHGYHRGELLCELCLRRAQAGDEPCTACSSCQEQDVEAPEQSQQCRCSPNKEQTHGASGVPTELPPSLPDRRESHEPPGERLRILCLHGFRQNAHTFMGRNAGLIRRLSRIAQLVCVDAPHNLPHLVKGRLQQASPSESGGAHVTELSLQDSTPLELQPDELPGETAAAGKSEQDESSAHQQQQRFPRRGWLVEPEQLAAGRAQAGGQPCCFVPAMDEGQYLRQTAGWQETWQYLQQILRNDGPFDGVMGYSQGASVATALCAHQQLCQGDPVGPGWQPLRFAILCSGYVSPAPEHQQLHAAAGSISLPSLHVFGTKTDAASSCGGVSAAESRALADCFDPCQRLVVEHSGGHYIPISKPVLTLFTQFLRQFI